jgi:hypothetical protein
MLSFLSIVLSYNIRPRNRISKNFTEICDDGNSTKSSNNIITDAVEKNST